MKSKSNDFMNFLLKEHSLISSASQLVYTILFLTFLSLSYILFKEGNLFEGQSSLLILIGFAILILFIRQLDKIISQYHGLGSFATYTYSLTWMISTFSGEYFIPSKLLIVICSSFILLPSVYLLYKEIHGDEE